MINRSIVLLITNLLLGLLLPGLVHAADPARVQLNAYRVLTVKEDGVQKERLQTLTQVRPGDVVEYEATYTNAGTSPVSGVMLTVPVPDGGLVYVEGGAQPAAALASLDGKSYAPMPLMRTHTLPDGRQVRRPVPAAEIRFLRWDLGQVAAGAARTVHARMQLPALVAAQPAPQVASR